MMKAPSAEEVVALVNAATGPDGMLDPVTHQLILQLQEHHALIQAQAQAQAQTQRDRTNSETNSTHSTSSDLIMPIRSESNLNESTATFVDVGAASRVSPLSAGSTTTVMTRKSIPLSMKKEAIYWIMGPGEGVPSRAERHFGALKWDVSASSFRKWWKNRDQILGNSGTKKRISGGGRKPFLDDSEEKLLVVVIQERAKKERITRKWIAKTAQHMFQRSNSTFKASENWVTKFIRRNGLTLKRSYVTFEPTKVEQRQQQSKVKGTKVQAKPTTGAADKYVDTNAKSEFVDL